MIYMTFFFSSRRRHTRFKCDWSSDVCSSDLAFEVKTTPLPPDDATGGAGVDIGIGRYALDKQFHGDLEAAGKGEMLGAGDPAKGTAGSVAIGPATGTLHVHIASFALLHKCPMDQGKLQ